MGFSSYTATIITIIIRSRNITVLCVACSGDDWAAHRHHIVHLPSTSVTLAVTVG